MNSRSGIGRGALFAGLFLALSLSGCLAGEATDQEAVDSPAGAEAGGTAAREESAQAVPRPGSLDERAGSARDEQVVAADEDVERAAAEDCDTCDPPPQPWSPPAIPQTESRNP